MLVIPVWVVAAMGCGEETPEISGGRPRATQAPPLATIAPATIGPTSEPTPRWTLPPPTPSPTPVVFRTPIPQESVALPDPTPTPELGLEPEVE